MRSITIIIPFIAFLSSSVPAQDIGPEDKITSVYFSGGSYYLDREQAEQILEFISDVKDLRDYYIEIHGHTDNIGSYEYNQYLSKMRNESVFKELLKLDIEHSLISLHDFGELSPSYSNNSWTGRRRNRRVDIVLKKLRI